jgi:hypothetical protein
MTPPPPQTRNILTTQSLDLGLVGNGVACTSKTVSPSIGTTQSSIGRRGGARATTLLRHFGAPPCPARLARAGLFFRQQHLRRTAVVAMVRRSAGADTAARRATATAERCRNMVSVVGKGGCCAGQLVGVVFGGGVRPVRLVLRNGLTWVLGSSPKAQSQPSCRCLLFWVRPHVMWHVIPVIDFPRRIKNDEVQQILLYLILKFWTFFNNPRNCYNDRILFLLPHSHIVCCVRQKQQKLTG